MRAVRKSNNPWLSEEISRLLNLATFKWKKNDWVDAAKFLAREGPKGLINEAMNEGIKRDLSEHINNLSKRPRGHPEWLTTVKVKEWLVFVEDIRQQLAGERDKNPSKITDKAVARKIAEIAQHTRSAEGKTLYAKRKSTIELPFGIISPCIHQKDMFDAILGFIVVQCCPLTSD